MKRVFIFLAAILIVHLGMGVFFPLLYSDLPVLFFLTFMLTIFFHKVLPSKAMSVLFFPFLVAGLTSHFFSWQVFGILFGITLLAYFMTRFLWYNGYILMIMIFGLYALYLFAMGFLYVDNFSIQLIFYSLPAILWVFIMIGILFYSISHIFPEKF